MQASRSRKPARSSLHTCSTPRAVHWCWPTPQAGGKQTGAPLVPVDSCFGGLAVYRMEAFASGSYAGGDCEHVTFHASLRRAGFGRIFLDPSLLALYPDFVALYPRSRYAQQVAAAEAARTAAG